ncbi:hypothetical protein N0V93_008821 [Gnomoniopsis smithogilvyi]|uniref:Uncharacterized protein n=1 Tax=Gnomoniopsis smithogilvyi TaxID=1191159 RepID=A0A9W8YNR8_9PEZI|nr:hypothetical protein N0V93_008821 [Gnomoniopsis smithogilvyi]
MASKEALRKALLTWPTDPLRPTAQLGAVLNSRLSSSTLPAAQQNASLGLLANKFSTKYALPAPEESMSGGIMMPRSNPEYYKALMRDLEEVPTRTWAQRLGLKLKGMIRWS